MKNLLRFIFLAAVLFLSDSIASAASLPIYLEEQDGLQSEKKQDYVDAIARYKVTLIWLKGIQKRDPNWETNLVAKKINDVQERVDKAQPLADEQVLKELSQQSSVETLTSNSFEEGNRQESSGNLKNALEQFQACLLTLEIVNRKIPQQEERYVRDKTSECRAAVVRLSDSSLAQILKQMDEFRSGNTVQ